MAEKKQKTIPEENLTPEELLAKIAAEGHDNVQGLSNLISRLTRANQNLKKQPENPINKVRDATPLPAGKKTGPKTPITGTNESDSGN